MRLATLQFERKIQKCIRMGITIFKISFREVYRRIYVRKSRFTAPLARRRKTKFPTVYPTIYLPKWKFWIQLSPKWQSVPRLTQPLITSVFLPFYSYLLSHFFSINYSSDNPCFGLCCLDSVCFVCRLSPIPFFFINVSSDSPYHGLCGLDNLFTILSPIAFQFCQFRQWQSMPWFMPLG